MKTIQFIKNIVACCIASLISQSVIAANASEITCPTSGQISQFNYEAAFPYGFDKHSQRAKFIMGAEEPNAAASNIDGNWLLFIYPISARQSDDVQAIAQSVIGHLVPVTPTAFQFNLVDDIQLPFCVYSLPGHDDVTAMAYFIDNGFGGDYDDDDFSAKIHSKANRSRLRMMKIVRQLFIQ